MQQKMFLARLALSVLISIPTFLLIFPPESLSWIPLITFVEYGSMILASVFFVTAIPFHIYAFLMTPSAERPSPSRFARRFLIKEAPKVILVLLLLYFKTPIVNYDNGIRCIAAPCPSGWTSLSELGALGGATIYGVHYELLPLYFFQAYYILTILMWVIDLILVRLTPAGKTVASRGQSIKKKSAIEP